MVLAKTESNKDRKDRQLIVHSRDKIFFEMATFCHRANDIENQQIQKSQALSLTFSKFCIDVITPLPCLGLQTRPESLLALQTLPIPTLLGLPVPREAVGCLDHDLTYKLQTHQ